MVYKSANSVMFSARISPEKVVQEAFCLDFNLSPKENQLEHDESIVSKGRATISNRSEYVPAVGDSVYRHLSKEQGSRGVAE